MDKNDIPNYMNNINDIELDEEILNKQLIEYNNDFIIIPSIINNKLELNFDKINIISSINTKEFAFNSKKNLICKFPILLLKNNKLIAKSINSLDKAYFIKDEICELLDNNNKALNKIMQLEFGEKINNNNLIYYITISDEIRTLIRFDKDINHEDITSYDLKNNVYFTGNKQKNWKIQEKGKCCIYRNDNYIKVIKSNTWIFDNKFFYCFNLFDVNDSENKLYLKMPNLFHFNEYTKIKHFLHKDELLYKSAKSDWICYFCEKRFKKNEASFGCRKCDFDLCPECIFEDENMEINKMYIKLKYLNIDGIKYNKINFLIKSFYHNHELEYHSNIINIPGLHHCSICDKTIINNNFQCNIKNNECNFYLCKYCVYNQEKDKNYLLNKLNNSFFEMNINNFPEKIFGFFMKCINDNNIIKLHINNSWDNIKSYIKNDFFEIILFNNEKIIKIYLKDIKEVIISLEINTNTSCFGVDKKFISDNNIDIDFIEAEDELFYKNKLIDYNNKSIVIPNFDKNKKFELYSGIINTYDDSEKENKIYIKNIELKNNISGLPILLLSNFKFIAFSKKFENDNEDYIIDYTSDVKIIHNYYKCFIYCFLNLRPSSSENCNRFTPTHMFLVEKINDYSYNAQIKIISVKILDKVIKNANNFIIKNITLPIIWDDFRLQYFTQQKIGDLIIPSDPIKNCFFSKCPQEFWPFIEENFSFNIKYEDKNVKITIPKKVQISPFIMEIEGIAEFYLE